MNVLIGTPAYGGMVHLDYLKSLLEYQRHGLPFSLASFGNESLAGLTMYDVFQVGVVDGEYLSEDFWLCKELGELGYHIYISDAVTVIHHGMHGFKAKKSP